MPMLQEKLKLLGLNEKEIIIYLTIYKHKRVIPSTISYITKINRTTVYSIIRSLASKNLVIEEIKDSQKEIICLPIENFHNLIQIEKIEIIKKEKAIEDIIKEIKDGDQQDIYIPKMKNISEENIENYLYSNFHKWNTSALNYDNTWWGFQDTKFPYYYIDWIDHVWKKSPKEIHLKLLSDESIVEKQIGKKFERRQILFSNTLNDFDGTTWVIGDYIINIFLDNKPFYIIEMYNPILAKNMRKIFKDLWDKEIHN
ncbi:MAG: TrmB family transcriptional regulator [Candidatus Gracilibacteria bacterium]|nr:TrmB family transcriptional regulator [Candidatus Gracilibacteria bacterium]